MKFAAIAADVGLAEIHTRYHVKALVKAGRLRATGWTGSRRYSLPGAAAPAAKEEP